MTVDHAARIVQLTYPQVYLACHTRHQRKRSTEHRLSQRDSAILAHLDEMKSITPALLAKHLGIARSTMSEALKKLIALGFVLRAAPRSAAVVLSDLGARAVQETSVLESDRLAGALARVPARDRQLICSGLQRLADACRQLGGGYALT